MGYISIRGDLPYGRTNGMDEWPFHVCAGRAGWTVIQKFHRLQNCRNLNQLAWYSTKLNIYCQPEPGNSGAPFASAEMDRIAVVTLLLWWHCYYHPRLEMPRKVHLCIKIRTMCWNDAKNAHDFQLCGPCGSLMPHPELFFNSGESICKQPWRKNSVLENAVQRERNFFFLGVIHASSRVGKS